MVFTAEKKKSFPDVMGEIFVIAMGLFAAYLFLQGFFDTIAMYDEWPENAYILLLIGVAAVVVAIYAGYSMYKKLSSAGFKVEKISKPSEERKAVGEFFKGAGALGGAFIVCMVIVVAVVLLVYGDWSWVGGGEYVEVDGIKFAAPAGWTVTKHPDAYILVEVVGPDEGNTMAYFSIERDSYSGGWEDAVYYFRGEMENVDAEILSEYNTSVGGKQAVEFTYRVYMHEKGYYGKGKLYAVNVGGGEAILITFASKEDLYYKNLAIVDKIIPTIQFTG